MQSHRRRRRRSNNGVGERVCVQLVGSVARRQREILLSQTSEPVMLAVMFESNLKRAWIRIFFYNNNV